MTAFVLAYGDDRIPYRVSYVDARKTRVAIHVNPDGSVAVDAPIGFSDESIKHAVQKRARWVIEHVREAQMRYAQVRHRHYVSGEQILYLGRRYVLKVIRVDRKAAPVRLRGNRLEVETDSRMVDDVKGRVRGWYRERGRCYLGQRIGVLSKALPWVDAPPSFRLMEMSRQWGSCSPSGEIILNTHLVKAPRQCIDYVLIHELAHLKHHDHSPEFWRLIDSHAGNWRQAKQNLDDLVEVLLA